MRTISINTTFIIFSLFSFVFLILNYQILYNYEHVYAFKPSNAPSEVINGTGYEQQSQQSEQAKQQDGQQQGNQTKNTLSDVGKALGNLFK